MENTGTIGQSVVIKGDLSAKEDLIVEGQVEGTVKLDSNVLTVGASGHIKAQIEAKAVIVTGKVTGDITATEKIDLHAGATVEGDLTAPRVGIAEGAHFQGAIDMRPAGASSSKPKDTGGAGGSSSQPVRAA